MLKMLFTALLFFQQAATNPPVTQPPVKNPTVQLSGSSDQDDAVEYRCPMDKDYRSTQPGKCPICGMTLVLGMPDAHEYPIEITTTPKNLKPNEDVLLNFRVEEPDNGKTVKKFVEMHTKLYHLFVMSQDLQYFQHIHPEQQADGSFNLPVKFPHPGMYRILSDIYPADGTPQLIASTMMVPGKGFSLTPAKLNPDVAPKKTENMDIQLVLDPPQPLAGFKTIMFFRLKPNDGIEPYLGAMGHMLAASSDLIDLMHTHPLYVTEPDDREYKQIQFNLIFPRPGVYRVWTQFQRKGVVNTVVFDIPVKELD
jgi:hypothetical protein